MKNLIKNVEFYFIGFYESIHSYNIDEYIEDREININEIEYKNLLIEYSKEYINKFNYEFDTNIIFEELISPKYYNYSTDKIYVSISNEDILSLIKYLKTTYSTLDYKELLQDKIKEVTTSRDGYIPYYSYKDIFKKDNRNIFISLIIDIIFELDNNLEDNISYNMDI